MILLGSPYTCSLTSKGKINGDAVSAPTVACGLANCEHTKVLPGYPHLEVLCHHQLCGITSVLQVLVNNTEINTLSTFEVFKIIC